MSEGKPGTRNAQGNLHILGRDGSGFLGDRQRFLEQLGSAKGIDEQQARPDIARRQSHGGAGHLDRLANRTGRRERIGERHAEGHRTRLATDQAVVDIGGGTRPTGGPVGLAKQPDKGRIRMWCCGKPFQNSQTRVDLPVGQKASAIIDRQVFVQFQLQRPATSSDIRNEVICLIRERVLSIGYHNTHPTGVFRPQCSAGWGLERTSLQRSLTEDC